jgi:hypothetical protein
VKDGSQEASKMGILGPFVVLRRDSVLARDVDGVTVMHPSGWLRIYDGRGALRFVVPAGYLPNGSKQPPMEPFKPKSHGKKPAVEVE